MCETTASRHGSQCLRATRSEGEGSDAPHFNTDIPTWKDRTHQLYLGISAEHMDSYEVECMTNSIPIHVTCVDSHTRRGMFSRVSAMNKR